MMSSISQKEYLKKYLGRSKETKKKRKKIKNHKSRVQIIDDSEEHFESAFDENGELLDGEDAPQIVAVIDDRPPSLRIDEKTKANLWIPIGVKLEESEDKKVATISSDFDRDSSPPRRNKESIVKTEDCDRDNSPLRRRNVATQNVRIKSEPRDSDEDVDNSPPRRKKNKDRDNSPPRRKRNLHEMEQNKDRDSSPPRRRKSDNVRSKSRDGKKSRWGDGLSENTENSKKSSMSDGKKAGFQDFTSLIKENQKHVKKEAEFFANLPDNVSGQFAETVFRDRKSGKVRDLAKEAEDKSKKVEKENELKEKYSKWGKGLKQVEDRESRIAEEIREMNKPLARYADDEDLERHLKERELDGDPMLAYIRRKKKKQAVIQGKPSKPVYEGDYMPNRFAIRPGYRWDGVDRSNGYETRWLEKQNSNKAFQEESHAWSVEEM